MYTVSKQLQPNRDVIENFLSDVVQTDIHLAAIRPDGTISGDYFGSDVEAATSWAVAQNTNGRGVYYTGNRCHSGVTTKSTKADITSARFVYADIDPPKDGSPFDKAGVVSELLSCGTPPSVIVDTGNGIQPLWLLTEGSEDFDRVEAINRSIASHWGGDNCHNIDRLLRLPGTVNYPNQKKLERGCTEIASYVLSQDLNLTYTLDELEAGWSQVAAKPVPSRKVEIAVPSNLTLLTSADLTRGSVSTLLTMLDDPTRHFRVTDRSSWVFGIACQMADDGYSDAEILGVLLNPVNVGCVHVVNEPNPTRAATRAIIRARQRHVLPPGGSIFGNKSLPTSNRPKIKIVGGDLANMADQAEQALIDADVGYYQAGGRIVRIGFIPSAKVCDMSNGRVRIFDVGEAELIEAFTLVADWVKLEKERETKVNCPTIVAQTYMARGGKWKLSPLTGVIDIPTIRPDGSLLSIKGYDVSTGLLYSPGNTALPVIPQSPTKADALIALTKLKGPLSHFPFLTNSDEAVALSAMLTSVCRMALSSAPLHGFSAPTAGSGKSILADIASILRTGREAAPIAQGKTAEEFEKRLGSILLEGDGCVAIDNCETPLGGEFLCQALTQPSLKVRVLGKSMMVEVSTAALFTATGNNLTFIGDMGRRALLCQLDPGVERPELRKFEFDPVQVFKNSRGEFIAAALTILRAYHVAGRPFQVAPLGSFADWSNLVRSALIWLGCADPCDTMDKVRKADPELAQIKLMMTQWDIVVGAKGVTTGELTTLATEMVEVSGGSFVKKPKHPEFRDALLATAGDGQNINGRRLGNWLSKRKERVVGGKKFISTGDRGGQLVWRLEHVSAVSGATTQ
jgi:putative DNA primase/helicase